MPGKLATILLISRPITMTAEQASMSMKGRRARPASLGAESIVGLTSANAAALGTRWRQDALEPCRLIGRSHFIIIAHLQAPSLFTALSSSGAANNRSLVAAIGMIPYRHSQHLGDIVRCLAISCRMKT